MLKEPPTGLSMLTVVCLAAVLAVGAGEGGERSSSKPGDARSEIVVTPAATSMPVSRPAPLPHGLSYCDTEPCASIPPLVIYVCSTSDPECTPTRRTTIIPRVDGKTISGLSLSIFAPSSTSIRLVSGSGAVLHSTVWNLGSSIILGSDEDVEISHYSVVPVWGGTTNLNFESITHDSALLDSVFYRHAKYDIGTAVIDLHAHGQKVITTERATAGLTSKHVTAIYFPPEMNKGGLGEGNFWYGNGAVGINYGSPSAIGRKGGIMNGALPIFAHEYAHELFDEIKPMFSGDSSCLNEGIADALAFSVGFIPEEILGPVTTDRVNFDSDCSAVIEVHDVGNCYFWHVKKAGLLTPKFLYGIFHPQHTFNFNSCDQNAITTGDSILVYFTEAAGGANMVPVLNSMKIPHTGSYSAAKQTLGFR
jgi:hypothetical protein